jgi:hypothetical protein
MVKTKLIDAFFKSSISATREGFMKFGKVETASVFILESNGNAVLIPLPFNNVMTKDMAADLIADMVRILKPMALCFVSEGWVTKRSVDDPTNGDIISGKTSVSEQPDKEEVIICVMETRSSSVTTLIPILRTNGDVRLGKEEKMEGGKGRFTHLLAK